MLNNKEKLVMTYIFNKCEGRESVLITPEELLNFANSKYDLTIADINEIVDALVLESMITMILSDKKGKPIFCISLEKKGESFLRDLANNKKKITMLIIRTVLLAVLSFVVGLILKAIF